MAERAINDQSKANALGRWLDQKWLKHRRDRYSKEIQWMKNLRQEKGMYDQDMESKMRNEGSRAYPKLTRLKVRGTVSRIMEMMFPQSEKNYELSPSPVPNLRRDDLNFVLQQATAAKQAAQPAPQPVEGQPPAPPEPVTLTNAEIEDAIKVHALAKSIRMTTEIDDSLVELGYVDLAREVVKSGTIYGLGVLMGPLVDKQMVRTWNRDPNNGQYTAVEAERLCPRYDVVRCWDYYPDLTAVDRKKQDVEILRRVISKPELLKLKTRPDYIPKQINRVIELYADGNYVEEHWETQLRARKSDRQNVSDITVGKYNLIEGWGMVTGRDLWAVGEKISENELNKLMMAWVVVIGGVVIKAVKAPFDRQTSIFHTFTFNSDDTSLLGTGLPEDMRDSQLAVAEAARMLMDNCSAVCGPMLEIDIDLLMDGQNLDMHSYKAWLKEGDKGSPTNAGNEAVRNIKIESHIAELLQVMELFMNFADMETALPPPALGDVGQGGSEALRTTGGASMIMGAAALPIRDIVRNFDTFTVSVITSLYDWLMEFRANEDIKGDFHVVARGSTSLVAKEVRATQLNQLSATFTPAELDHLNERKLVEAKIAASDLPNELVETENVVKQKRDAAAAQQQKQEGLIEGKVMAEVKKLLSDVVLNLAKAQGITSDAAVNVGKGVAETITEEEKVDVAREAAEAKRKAGPA